MKNVFYNIKNSKFLKFIRNAWHFRKELSDFYKWDYTYNLQMLRRSLILTADHIEKYGNEVDESRLLKVQNMRRTITLLDSVIEGDFIGQAEQILNIETKSDFKFEKCDDSNLSKMIDNLSDEDKENNKQIFALSDKLEEEQWKELWNIINDDMKGWWD
jgi:hypothetical protein